MGASENLELHRRWSEAENSHDTSHLGDFLHDDIEFHVPGSDAIRGLAAYGEMLETTWAGLSEFTADNVDRFATDDRLACRWLTRGVHTGEYMGLPATGRKVEFAGVSIWEFEGGKVRRGYAFPDIAAVMTQLMS